MKNYKSIAAFSKQCQRISASVLDDFLISYVASQKKFSRIIKKSRKYKHIFQELQPELPELFITQLLAHQIFKENGMIRSLLNHRAVKDSTPEEYEYLQLMAELPWRFSFSTIEVHPEKKIT